MTAQSGITWPYLRRMQLTVSGLKDLKGERVFESDGTRKNLRISATIQKHIQGPGSVSEIRIWNLAPDTRSRFQRRETKVALMAGWGNTGMAIAFRGNLLTSQSNRAGPDIVTTLIVQSGRETCTTTPIINSWPAGYRVRDIVIDIAKRLENITVDPTRVVKVRGVLGFSGWSHCGDAEEALDDLAREWGFSWTILDDKFQALGDDDAIGKGAVVKEPYLIDVSPVLVGYQRYQRGVNGRCTYNPVILPGEMIEIQSAVEPACNGRFVVNKVENTLDCFEQALFITAFTAHARPGVR